MLFVLLRNSLRFVSLDTEDFTDMEIPLMNISHGVALGFDPVDDYLYWTDNDAHGISRARIDGTGIKLIKPFQTNRNSHEQSRITWNSVVSVCHGFP